MSELWQRFSISTVLGACLVGQQKYAEAEPLLLRGYEGLQHADTIPTSLRSKRLNQAQGRLVRLYEAWGKPDQASRWRQQLVLPQPAPHEADQSSLKKPLAGTPGR